ncbi:MAG: helix-turn-helix domain-containing protein [Hyphomicrobium sp.]
MRRDHAAQSGVREHIARNCATIGRYFLELRSALRLTPHQAAVHLQAHPDIVETLEAGRIDALPPWPETVRIVTAYAAMAGADGRPALSLIADTLSVIAQDISVAQPVARLAAPAPASASTRSQPKGRIRHAVAAGARLPQDAIRGARRRPDRAFYAISLPLGLLLLATLNSPGLTRARTSVGDYFRVQFASFHEGFRWIEVSDPRVRRGDKLQGGKR